MRTIQKHLLSTSIIYTRHSLERKPISSLHSTFKYIKLNDFKRQNFSTQQAHQTVNTRPILKVEDVLSTKPKAFFTIDQSSTIDYAISHLVEQNLSSALTINTSGEITGVFTARDILRLLHGHGSKQVDGKALSLSLPISEVTTKKEKMIFCGPKDTVRHCREIMSQLRIRNLPVIENGEVVGIITLKDLADSAFQLSNIGGKKGFIHNVTGRRGLPAGTVLNPEAREAAIAKDRTPSPDTMVPRLSVSVGVYEIPHPFKHSQGVAASRRDYGPNELATDVTLCEDAHFAISVRSRGVGSNPGTQVYACVADGVGSWRQYGVDPRLYAHTLVQHAKDVVLMDELRRLHKIEDGLVDDMEDVRRGMADLEPVHPLDAMIEAWHATGGREGWTGGITGSSTVCIATIDPYTNQLSYSNLGDCGLLVVRHIDSEVAGYMRERRKPRHLRNTDLRLAYISQQQLKGFNMPYQLGFSDIPDHSGVFETPADADTDEIVAEVAAWELEYFPTTTPSSTTTNTETDQPQSQSSMSHQQKAVQVLSERLCHKARDLSLDGDRDSPFAVLAKENDIMWSGGMPDDTTVIAMRVSNRQME
eukprot:gene9951-20687_t